MTHAKVPIKHPLSTRPTCSSSKGQFNKGHKPSSNLDERNMYIISQWRDLTRHCTLNLINRVTTALPVTLNAIMPLHRAARHTFYNDQDLSAPASEEVSAALWGAVSQRFALAGKLRWSHHHARAMHRPALSRKLHHSDLDEGHSALELCT